MCCAMDCYLYTHITSMQMCERAAETYASKSPKPPLRRTSTTTIDAARRLSNAGAYPQRTASGDPFSSSSHTVSSIQVCSLKQFCYTPKAIKTLLQIAVSEFCFQYVAKS